MWRWCGLTGNEGAAVKMDRNERILRMRWLSERRLFLLGLNNSGKSTIYKQLRIIHGEGYSEEERKAFTKTVFQDIFTAMTTLAEAMTTLNIPYSNPENQLHAQCIQDVETSQVTTLEARHADAIRQLWADPGVRACYSRRREFELLDSTKYYMDNLERMAAPGYIPTNQDVVRAKTTNTCLPECSFDFGGVSVRIWDTPSFRRLFSRPLNRILDYVGKTIVFVASLSEYDCSVGWDENEYLLQEGTRCFYNLLHSRIFDCAHSIILFLNKMDILAEKIQTSDLQTYYPEFTGKKGDAQAAMDFIRELYQKETVNRDTGNRKLVYIYFTCATDAENIRQVFNEALDRSLATRCHF